MSSGAGAAAVEQQPVAAVDDVVADAHLDDALQGEQLASHRQLGFLRLGALFAAIAVMTAIAAWFAAISASIWASEPTTAGSTLAPTSILPRIFAVRLSSRSRFVAISCPPAAAAASRISSSDWASPSAAMSVARRSSAVGSGGTGIGSPVSCSVAGDVAVGVVGGAGAGAVAVVDRLLDDVAVAVLRGFVHQPCLR
jgi:hypothetical protein